MEDETYEYVEGPTGRKFRAGFLVVRFLVLIAAICQAFGELYAGIAQDVLNHSNYKTEREQFAADAGLELETLLEGSAED